MADQKKRNIPLITEKDVQALESVLADLKAKAKEANTQGSLTTFRMYQRLIKTVAPEVNRFSQRYERQDQAEMNRAGQVLKEKLATTASKQP